MTTVLMAVFQGERYLREQLDSIFRQSVSDLKILISDDGSTDRTVGILREYQERFPEQVNILPAGEEERKGLPGAAGNFFRLFSAADSDYCFLSDQDDVWEPWKAERMINGMKMLEQQYGKEMPILMFSDAKVVDEKLDEIAPSFFAYQRLNPERSSLGEVLIENPVTGGSAVFNQALLDRLRQMPETCVMHDWWMALTAAAFGRLVCIHEPLYRYRQHGSNTLGARKTGSLADLKNRMAGRNQIRENYSRIFKQAACFFKLNERELTEKQKETVKAFLSLPGSSAAKRLNMIRKYGFQKSLALQTAAMCLTIPEDLEL